MDQLRTLRKSRCLPLFQEIRAVAPTRPADEALLSAARIVSEGEVVEEQGRGEIYYGSTLVTIALDGDAFDLGPAAQNPNLLCEVMQSSVLLRLRLLRLARQEAERRCFPRLVSSMSSQTDFKIVDRALFIDINIECPLAVSDKIDVEKSEGHR